MEDEGNETRVSKAAMKETPNDTMTEKRRKMLASLTLMYCFVAVWALTYRSGFIFRLFYQRFIQLKRKQNRSIS